MHYRAHISVGVVNGGGMQPGSQGNRKVRTLHGKKSFSELNFYIIEPIAGKTNK